MGQHQFRSFTVLERFRVGSQSEMPGWALPWSVLQTTLALYEPGCFMAASATFSWMGSQFGGDGFGEDPSKGALIGLAAGVIYVILQFAWGMYECRILIDPVASRRRIWAAIAVTSIALVIAAGARNEPAAVWGAPFAFIVLAGPLLMVGRSQLASLLKSLLDRNAVKGRRAVVAGSRAELESLNAPEYFQNFGVEIVGRLTLPDYSLADGLGGFDRAEIDRVIAFSRQAQAREIYLALGAFDENMIDTIGRRFGRTPLPVKLVPGRSFRRLVERRYGAEMSPRSWFVDLRADRRGENRSVLKRAIDIVGASIALIMLSPLLLVTAILIKLDSDGPVLFRQRRSGFNEEVFQIYKFRTMRVLEDGDRVVQAWRGDPRVTRVGRILRRWSIDELPQLINVVVGDMSLVGPRPHALAHDREYAPRISAYPYRLHVKPGMTGLAQVKGLRGETDMLSKMRQRVMLDIWYARHWSIGLDLWILLRTPIELFKVHSY